MASESERSRRSTNAWLAVALCMPVLLIFGCPPKRPPPSQSLIAEEPEPAQTVIDRYNANADRMPEGVQLVGPHVELEAGFLDEDGNEQTFVGEGVLHFVKPRKFHLPLDYMSLRVAEIGSDGERYWLCFNRRETAWWGYYKYIDRPHIREMPIRPDQLIETLGLCRLPSGKGWLQGPLCRVVLYPRPEYELSYWRLDEGMPRYDRLYGLSRRPPYLGERLVFFDGLGQESCEATPADFRVVDVQEGAGTSPGPIMPHRIWLRSPKGSAYLKMTITSPRLKPLTGRLASGGWYPMNPPKNWRVIQIDEEYDRPAVPASSPAPATGPSPTRPGTPPAQSSSQPTSPPK
jgi:hypothetical protein